MQKTRNWYKKPGAEESILIRLSSDLKDGRQFLLCFRVASDKLFWSPDKHSTRMNAYAKNVYQDQRPRIRPGIKKRDRPGKGNRAPAVTDQTPSFRNNGLVALGLALATLGLGTGITYLMK
ncbi:unnamed protein product [Bursaphelenchus okinawaensis]|uniref:Uncharacterized protein n=1 Tax=Bursaphelenchus okinawaensis TaxID=465554 RepID=A0A811K2F7_9BILA|nr:unnamed protein product [Bursaphelenchus okinawaensis]CAG9090680.1 unnamed protein product [Bursaphelenchus okinawaensis]